MAPEVFIDVFREALYVILILVSAAIVPSLLVGLLVSVFQAATSINEQTLSFLPRLLVTILAIIWGSHWALALLMDYFIELVDSIPTVVG